MKMKNFLDYRMLRWNDDMEKNPGNIQIYVKEIVTIIKKALKKNSGC